MKKTVISIYRSECDSLITYYKKVRACHEMEDIHRMRVSIKNIRVLLAVFHKASRGKIRKEKNYDLTDHLFKSAGSVREFQIQRKIIKEMGFRSPAILKKYLKKKQKKSIKVLTKEINRFKPKVFRKSNKALLTKVEMISSGRLNQTIHQSILKFQKQIVKLSGKRMDTRSLHSIRKYLKRMEEVIRINKKIHKSSGGRDLHKEIRTLRNKIGDWHDQVGLISTLRKYKKQEKNKKLRIEVSQLILTQEEENLHLIKKIRKELKIFHRRDHCNI